MKRILLGVLGTCAACSAAQALDEIRVGYITTQTGPAAILGKHQMNGWRLGLEKEGWRKDGDRLGGVPMKLIVGNDQQKPEIGLRVARRMLRSDKVHVVAGIVWSNVLITVRTPVVRARRVLFTTNAGPAFLAGKGCTPYFVSSANQNDQNAEPIGHVLSQEGVKSVFFMAPNYQAGKDMLAGFKRYYKGGRIAGQILFKLGQRDFQADISRVRASGAKALLIFAPGGMGISFMKQWDSSGAGNSVTLYTIATVDNLTLPAIGNSALGSYHTLLWDPGSSAPANQAFVKAYRARYKSMPSVYAVNAYDGARLLAAALGQVGRKLTDNNLLELAKAMRTVKYDSVRGPYRYNVNGFPIQNYYRREVVKGADGKPTIVVKSVVFRAQKDSHWKDCPEARRYPKSVD